MRKNAIKNLAVNAQSAALVTTLHGNVSHLEAAQRMTQFAAQITTKESAQALLRSAGILNSKNKLVKGLT